MDEDNTIRGNGFMNDSDEIHGTYAPPRYDDHYLDRLYDDISRDRFETPFHSGANTPAVLSRNNSNDNLAALSMMDSGRISGVVSPLRISSTSPGRWPANRYRISTPTLSPPMAGTFSNDELTARLNSHDTGDYFSSRPGRFARGGSGPSSRTHSPENLHGGNEELDFNKLSKVPSYTTAVRQGTKNLESISSLPQYDNGSSSAPKSTSNSPRNSPPALYIMPVMSTDRGGQEGSRSRLWGRRFTTSDTDSVDTSYSNAGGHLDVDRRVRVLQSRGR